MMRDMTQEEAKRFLAGARVGEYTLLDVRQPWEYEEFHLPGAVLIPLPELADGLAPLDRNKKTLVYCRSGNRSLAAAKLLDSQGFADVANVLGGASAWQEAGAVGSTALGQDLCLTPGDRRDVLLLAYGLEAALQRFYEELQGKASDEELRAAYQALADFENRHCTRLYRLYADADEHPLPQDAFASAALDRAKGRVEGGVDVAEYLSLTAKSLDSAADALDFAMMLEAQAMDFYTRCAQAHPGESGDVLRTLAQEEKGHMRYIAAMMDRMRPKS